MGGTGARLARRLPRPRRINLAQGGDWVVTKATDTGRLLVIEAETPRGHQAITIVNDNDQD